MEISDYTSSLQEMINLTENQDCLRFIRIPEKRNGSAPPKIAPASVMELMMLRIRGMEKLL